MQNNKVLGNKTEKLFLDLVKRNDGWATLIPSTILGQPVDVIAVINGVTYFVDIKHCASNRFSFGAIQDNQELAMELIWRASGRNALSTHKAFKIGFMIYFEPLRAFTFLSYGMFTSMSVNGEKSIMLNDERLVLIYG